MRNHFQDFFFQDLIARGATNGVEPLFPTGSYLLGAPLAFCVAQGWNGMLVQRCTAPFTNGGFYTVLCAGRGFIQSIGIRLSRAMGTLHADGKTISASGISKVFTTITAIKIPVR